MEHGQASTVPHGRFTAMSMLKAESPRAAEGAPIERSQDGRTTTA
jgi:hypothetical protein